MPILTQFCTTDGRTFNTRREANTHQKRLDCVGMLENLLTQAFQANGFSDDSDRDGAIAKMLTTHADDVINLLKGKPISSPEVDPADLEAAAEAAAEAEAQIDAAADTDSILDTSVA